MRKRIISAVWMLVAPVSMSVMVMLTASGSGMLAGDDFNRSDSTDLGRTADGYEWARRLGVSDKPVIKDNTMDFEDCTTVLYFGPESPQANNFKMDFDLSWPADQAPSSASNFRVDYRMSYPSTTIGDGGTNATIYGYRLAVFRTAADALTAKIYADTPFGGELVSATAGGLTNTTEAHITLQTTGSVFNVSVDGNPIIHYDDSGSGNPHKDGAWGYFNFYAHLNTWAMDNLTIIPGSGNRISGCDVVLGSHSAVSPLPNPYLEWWMPRHQAILETNQQGNVDLIMIGDSITHRWETIGLNVWNEYYAQRNAVNMGFGGDRTQAVLWRIQNGELDGISPKLATLLIGTNNYDGNTPEQTAEGIKAILCEIRNRLPNTKILLLAIFPRGSAEQCSDPSSDASYNPLWEKNDQVNAIIEGFADNTMIYYLNINNAFLNDDGVMTREIAPDLVHPSEAGYAIWAQSMEPMVTQLMGE